MRTRILLLALSALFLQAQVDANRGSIVGQVVDRSGAPIISARVIAIQTESGLERETRTERDGQFRLPAIPPGAYELRFESGAVSTIVRDVSVRVGAALQVKVSLALQNSLQSVDVSTSVLSIADAEMTQVIPYTAIRDLPINGRRFQEFATLTPTVTITSETMGQLSFVGQRGVNSNILVDGTDYNEPFLGGIRGGERSGQAFTIPQSAIQEFQTVTSGYSAEYGRSTGGVLNVNTRSGANALHGEGFYLIRDGALAAKTPLNQESLERQQQFGGAVGGRVIRDRLFFFGAAEQQFAHYPRQVRFGVLDGIQRTPDIAPAYDFFKSQEAPFRQTNDATGAFGRADYRFGAHALAGRYQFSRNDAENTSSLGATLDPFTNRAISNNGTELGITRSVGAQLTSVFSPALLNDFRLQHSFERQRRNPNSISPLIDAGVIGRTGLSPLLPGMLQDRRLQFADSLSLQKGRHSLKFGADYSYIDFYQWYGDNQAGAFVIANSDPTATLRILSGVNGNRFDDPSVMYRRQVGVLATQNAAHQLAFLAQDTWRIRPSVTLNLGLRWEGQINPQPTVNNDFLVNNVRNFPFPRGRVDATAMRNDFSQWAPRIGVSWNPGSGRTVVRAHAGLFYAQTPLILYVAPLSSFSTAPSDLSLEISPNANGTVYQQFLKAGFDLNQGSLGSLPVYTVSDIWMKVAGSPDPFANANVTTTSGRNFRNPRSTQMGFGIQRQIADKFIVDYQLNQVNTVHLPRNVDFNVPLPFVRPGDLSQRPFFGLRSGVSRPNPNLGQVLVRDSSAKSRYTGHSFRVQLNRSRFDLAANYTLGFNKSDDDSERAIAGFTYQNPFDFSREYNWSSIDARHTASGYTIYRAPLGFEAAALWRFRSGLPIDATTGADTSELLSGSRGNRPLERPGLPMLRNSFRNRSFQTIDARLLKSFRLTESAGVQFSAECFNLFNFDNVQFLPSSLLLENPAFVFGPGILTNGQIAPINPGFLKLRNAGGAYDPVTTGQQGTPLQVQFGLRLFF